MATPLDPICLFRVLADYKVEYVLIGGLAAVLHGSTVMTNDADIVPERTAENLACLGTALKDLNARIRSLDAPEGVEFDPHPSLLDSVSMLNMTTRCGDLDMVLSPAGIGSYAELVEAAVMFDLEELQVAVASLEDIIRSKAAADRSKDHVALPILYALREEIERQAGNPV